MEDKRGRGRSDALGRRADLLVRQSPHRPDGNQTSSAASMERRRPRGSPEADAEGRKDRGGGEEAPASDDGAPPVPRHRWLRQTQTISFPAQLGHVGF